MNTLEMEAYKAELARRVLNVNDREVLDSIKNILLRSADSDMPCQMPVDEAKQHLQASEKRFDEGKYIGEEQMREFFNTLQ